MSTPLMFLVGQEPDPADAVIAACLDLQTPQSFFLFAGAGSGKTRSLVRALEYLRDRFGAHLLLHNRQIAVITYTNAACDEITRRLAFDPLLSVSTIHSFVWEQIRGLDRDIRDWLREHLTREINELEAEQVKGRKGSQASVDRTEKLLVLKERLATLGAIQRFVYSPTGENRTRDSLSHAEVIGLGASFLTNKPLMQRLMVSRYPVLLIDESQDTNKDLIDAFFLVQAAYPTTFCLGLFGDTMQRIYADGKPDLGTSLPPNWRTPTKTINYRSPRRIVALINKVRAEVDPHQQDSPEDAAEGTALFFIVQSAGTDRYAAEVVVRKRMAGATGDARWNDQDEVKTLTLEHNMAAQRLGFAELFTALDSVRDFRTGLRDGTLPIVAFFCDTVLPLVTAQAKGNRFVVAAIIRDKSPLLSGEALAAADVDQAAQIKAARSGVESLAALFAHGAQPTLHDVLKCIASTRLFRLPQGLLPFVKSEPNSIEPPSEPLTSTMQGSSALESIRLFLQSPFRQIERYAEYVRGVSPFATHQGVKGLEFPRVLVVMDDAEAGGFLFSYEKFFGVKERTPTDLKNEDAGRETGIDRTRRLFYVTCSRAQQSLALVAYTTSPDTLRNTLLANGWFAENEIEVLTQ